LWSAIRDFSLLNRQTNPWTAGLKISVPVSQVERVWQATEDVAREGGLNCAVLAHAGSGILFPFLSNGREGPAALAQAIGWLQAKVREARGSLVTEWAPRSVKETVAVWGAPGPDWALMRRLKAEFDPVGILNPGRFLGDTDSRL
jgi:glycolate oxidase FAD binding subunit